MPRDRIAQLTSGDQLEARIALVWFWEGYYTRSGIDLTDYYGSELIQVTDLDLVATTFGPTLETRTTIGEAKSGRGSSAPKPLDRIVWLNGLMTLVGADDAELTINSAAIARAREVGRRLNVRVQSLPDLEEREKALRLSEVDNTGAHGIHATQLRKTVTRIVKDHRILNPAFKFLSSEVWFLDEFSAVKQCIGTLQTLKELWTPGAQDEEALAARWLIGEALSVLVFSLTRIAGLSRGISAKEFGSYVEERLAEGAVPAVKLRQLSKDIDRYISGLLVATNAAATLRVEAMGAFEPAAPTWAGSVVEVVQRIKRMAGAPNFPRVFDVIVHERIARARQIPESVIDRLDLSSAAVASGVGMVAAFLRSIDALPSDLSDVLTATVAAPEDGSAASSGALFELIGESGKVKD